jgi:hypothetical protein
VQQLLGKVALKKKPEPHKASSFDEAFLMDIK